MTNPEDLKVLIKEGLVKICPPTLVPKEYEALQFGLVPGQPGTHSDYLAVGMFMMSDRHMCIRDIMLYQPDSIQESPQLTLPWYEPPFLPTTSSNVMEPPRERRSPGEVATYLKGRYKPNTAQGKRQKELRWITTPPRRRTYGRIRTKVPRMGG
jgi:hypothetical protein